jgi:uncharacterized protein (TIGR04255 family)
MTPDRLSALVFLEGDCESVARYCRLESSMAKPRYLKHAPIIEAVIDFRAKLSPNFDVSAFKQLRDAVGYGEPRDIRIYEFKIHHKEGETPETHHDGGQIGVRFDSADGKQIVQFQKVGFFFSRLEPYTDWETVFAEASRLYRLYVQLAQPEEINRIAVRYINRLPLPTSEVGDFSPFLTAPPPFPTEIDAFMIGFLTQVQVKDPRTSIQATVSQTIQPSSDEPGKVPVILDLDVFEVGRWDPDPNSILEQFSALRALKNRYFFASITERTAELFE